MPFCLALLGLLTAPVEAQTVPDVPGDLIITEYMAYPSEVPDYFGEWFEVYNASGRAMNLVGLLVRDSTGANQFTVQDDLFIDVDQYLVMGVSDVSTYGENGYNGGIEIDFLYAFGDFEIGQQTDTIALIYDGWTVDSVTWDTSWAVQDAVSHQVNLNAHTLEWANDLSHNWCSADSYITGVGLKGTPGTENDWCEGANDDADGDGYMASEGDCDDADPYVNPMAIDGDGTDCILEGSDAGCGNPDDDADCDGVRDDGTTDDDGDTYTEAEGDCDDDNVNVFPGGEEGTSKAAADGLDNDCNCYIDDFDYDDDGFSLVTTGNHQETQGCQEPEVWDCDDSDRDANPDATEVPYDNIDNDCDGWDECDVDGDGYKADPAEVCPGGSCCSGGDDCDDGNPDVHPNASEGSEPDGIDNDCNGTVDDDFQDMDGDGFTGPDGDCLDDPDDPRSAEVYPGHEEECDDTLDNDCNGLINDGCSNASRFATVRGGGCAALPLGMASAGGLLLAVLMLGPRRRR